MIHIHGVLACDNAHVPVIFVQDNELIQAFIVFMKIKKISEIIIFFHVRFFSSYDKAIEH